MFQVTGLKINPRFIVRGLCKTVLLYKFFPKVFGRFQNPHVLLIRCGFEITQALTLNKIPDFAKPSVKENGFGRILIYRKKANWGLGNWGKTLFSEQLTMNSYQ